MKALKYLQQHEVIEQGVDALYERLGPADARRFIALTHSAHDDSVQRHRRWQASLDVEAFIKDVRTIHRRNSRKAARPTAARTSLRTGRKKADMH